MALCAARTANDERDGERIFVERFVFEKGGMRARVDAHGSPVVFAGVTVSRGDLVVADVDGVVFVPATAVDAVAALVAEKKPLEEGAREDLVAGMPIRDVWTKYGVF